MVEQIHIQKLFPEDKHSYEFQHKVYKNVLILRTTLSYTGNLFNIWRLHVTKLGLICPLYTLYTQQNKMHITYKSGFICKCPGANVLAYYLLQFFPHHLLQTTKQV